MSAIRIGDEKRIAAVCANCRYCRAKKFNAVIAASIADRMSCNRKSCTINIFSPCCGISQVAANRAWIARRSQTTSRIGIWVTNHFALVSKEAKQRVASATIKIPIRCLAGVSAYKSMRIFTWGSNQ